MSLVAEVNGVAQEGVINAKCIYSENTKEWKLHYYEIDNAGWSYYPIESAVLNGNEIIETFMSSSDVNFENETKQFTTEEFLISESTSLNLDLENESEKVEFTIEYKNGEFIGSSKCIADIKFIGDEWVVRNVDYDPIHLEWEDESSINTTRDNVFDFIDNQTFNGLYLVDKELESYVSSQDIIDFKILNEATPHQTRIALARAIIVADLDVANIESEIIIEYIKNNDSTWSINGISTEKELTKIKVVDNLVGNWKGYYILDGKKRSADLKITKFIESANIYEGVLSFGSSDTYKSKAGKYYFILSFDLKNRNINLDAGNWIEQPSGYYTVDFKLVLNEQNMLSGEPITFWGYGNDVCEFIRVTEDNDKSDDN